MPDTPDRRPVRGTDSPVDRSHSGLPDKTRDALIAAQLYYEQDLTMDTIARELGTSRSTVSRLLSHAKATGLVHISIHSPLEEPRQLESELRSRFGLSANVVPMPDRINAVDRLDRVARTAARVLTSYVDSNMRLGIAWGSTVTAISRHLSPRTTHNSMVVQLNGAANPSTTGLLYASEILQRFASAYSMTVQQFPVPALFDDPDTRTALWAERSIQRVLTLQTRLDVALFGLGSPFASVPSHVYSGGYLDAKDYDSMVADGVVGDVATVFYREDGTDDGIALNARSSGPPLETVRAISRRVCVIAGQGKLPALRGAIRAGLVTNLIIDAPTARELIRRTG
ncbi:sugar-binding transcriptional regulator [Mycetocola reblochoni]|uniref:Deoxyribonucleoside regulator DeoR (Transcriptional repressor) n=2 Tax=Mycetocola reblochoni TaxID=331618 RepID=A0A1R4JI35_9MICO|nr:sugar-binding domain-containing protein [Mycetocola reblochoni]RLP70536.1 MarR family transcriptional regulator [Mycetocola reblochoni]SJN31901.1 Deoxyribonucleoside regulator DeoR (transcriptional repressor) [Mycetocola reblochoni REB411]